MREIILKDANSRYGRRLTLIRKQRASKAGFSESHKWRGSGRYRTPVFTVFMALAFVGSFVGLYYAYNEIADLVETIVSSVRSMF